MKTITKFLFALVLLVAGASSVQAQRTYAYDLQHMFRPSSEGSALGMYYFLFKTTRFAAPSNARIIFYDSETNKEIGEYKLEGEELTSGTTWPNPGGYTVIIRSEKLTELLGDNSNGNVKWGVEVEYANSIVGDAEVLETLTHLENYTLEL